MPVQLGCTGIVIVGAGPAGLAQLFAAASDGRLDTLLDRGITILERSAILGSGALSEYAIASDSAAEAFLDIVLDTKEPRLRELCTHPVTRQLMALGKQAAPLSLVASFLNLAAQQMCGIVARSQRGRVFTGTEALYVTQTSRSGWRTRFRDLASGFEYELESASVVLATGAHQPAGRLMTEVVAGQVLSPAHQHKMLQSGTVLSQGGVAAIAQRLSGRANPRIAILGGSTSAGSVAAALLDSTSGLSFQQNGITLLHRKPLRIFYETVDEALAEGYCEFSGKDICHITGRLYRLSGFRSAARELILATRGIGDRPSEQRLRLFQLGQNKDAYARQLLDEADLIVACFGYRPRLLPVFNQSGRAITLFSPAGETWSVVDGRSRVLTGTRTALEGLFAVGLAVGPGASRELGGETDFHGQVNSLWMWQHTLGAKIATELLASSEGRRSSSNLPTDFLSSISGITSPENTSIFGHLAEAQ